MDGHGIHQMWGQLLPNFNDIEPEEMEEPLPQIGGSEVSYMA